MEVSENKDDQKKRKECGREKEKAIQENNKT